eukprot:3882164-Rhodomonas_salina.2
MRRTHSYPSNTCTHLDSYEECLSGRIFGQTNACLLNGLKKCREFETDSDGPDAGSRGKGGVERRRKERQGRK